MKGCTRTSLLALLAFVGTLLSGNSAFAEGYSVDFGVDTIQGRDADTISCQFDKICDGKIESLGLTIRLRLDSRNSAQADVRLKAGASGCCYFANNAPSIFLDPRETVFRIPLFKGEGSRGGLFIQNDPAGNLYLKFHLH